MKILIMNGPNLNLLGKREPEIYGSEAFEDFLANLRGEFKRVEIDYFQSNSEGAMIDKLHEVGFSFEGIILNAAAYSHTSIALADAVSSIKAPVVMVHISNTFSRESFRHKDVIAGRCAGLIAGLGFTGYKLAVDYFLKKMGD